METNTNAQPNPSSLGALLAADGLLDALPWGVLVLDEQRLVQHINQQAARWCGTSSEALLGRSLAEADLPAAIGGALQRLLEPGEAPACEVYLPEQKQWVALSVSRQPDGWVLYGQDITPQKQHEAEALRLQDELARCTTDQYHALFHSMDQGFCVLELQFDDTGLQVVDFRYQQVNPVFSRQSGIPEGAQGKTSRELMPDLEPFWFDTYGRVVLTGESVRLEHYVPQVSRWFDAHAFRVGGPETRQVAVLFTDITARKQADERLRLAAAADTLRLLLADALGPLNDPVALQEAVTRLARQHFQADRCYYVEIEGDQGIIRHDAFADGLPSLVGTYPLADFTLLQVVIEAGRPFSVRDVREDESVDEGLRQLCAQLQAVSCLIVPVIKTGQATGVLCLVQSAPRDWTAAEATLAADVAERTWAAVERARAEQAQAASEIQYRTLFTSIDEGFCTVEVLFDALGGATDYRFLEANPAFVRQTGLENAVGRTMRELAPAHEAFWYETYGRIAQTGEVQRFEHEAAALGSFYDVYAFRIGAPAENRVAILFNDITARKRHEANLALLADVSQDLVRLTSIAETMAALGEKLGAHFHASACVFNDVDEAAGLISAVYDWHRADVPSLKGVYRYEDFHSEEFRRASRAGETYVVRDSATDPRVNSANLAAIQIGAYINVPLVRHGEWLFNLALCDSGPRDWRPDEVELMRELTARIWTRLERARAEVALGQSEARYRELFELMGQGYGIAEILVDEAGRPVDYRMLEINPPFEQLTGQKRETFLDGRTVREIAPELEEEWYEFYGNVALTGVPAQRTFHAEARNRWFEVAAYPTGPPERRQVGIFFSNITERKRVEQQLAEFSTQLEQQVVERTHELSESQARLQSVFDSTAHAVTLLRVVHDAAGGLLDFEYVLVNPVTQAYHGSQNLIGRRYRDLLQGTQRQAAFEQLVTVVKTGRPADFEVYHDHEGDRRWFRLIGVKVNDGVLYSAENITARKQAEQERTRTLRLLEQAEAVAGLGSWDYDLLTREFLWSEGMYQLFGLPLGQAIEPHIYLDFVVDEDRPRAEQFVCCLTTGCADFEETLRLRVGGQVKTVRLKVVVLHDEAGQPVRVLGVDLDISQLQRLEGDNLRLRLTQQQALFEAVQAAQETERKRMAESLHNGIGQTLYATKLRLDQLHAPLLGTNPALVTARNEADQLLVEAIRQTRALSHELVPMVLEKFGLATALQNIGRNMSTPQLRFHCHLQLDEDAAPLAPALQMALYRMAQELAQNIVKHARGATQASLELETMPGWALLRAEDNGAGFATSPADSPGLGLRSIRDRVALLGGQLEMSSAPIDGAYVRIRIPIPASPAQ